MAYVSLSSHWIPDRSDWIARHGFGWKKRKKMKKDDTQKTAGEREQAGTPVETASDKNEKREAPEHETMEEKAKRENWTDVAESHLGIDE